MKQQFMQQQETTVEEFTEKIERAKKLYALFNDVTFGDKIESTQSRIVLRKLM
jgi:acyl-CoA-binding protein